MKNSRWYYIDYLRFISVICIIGIHASDIVAQTSKHFSIQWWYSTILQILVRIGLPIFFMMSGALLLNGKEESLFQFYVKRFSKVAIPFIAYSFFYLFIFNYKWSLFSLSNLVHSLLDILKGPVFYHLWFVYTLLGLYVVAPFLKAMLQGLSNKILINLMIVILILRCISIYLPVTGVNLGLTNYVFDNWVMYFISGYMLTRDLGEKFNKAVYRLGVISFIFTIIIIRYIPSFSNNLFDLSPTMVLMTASVFLFFKQSSHRFPQNGPIYWVISLSNKYSYSIYLIHAFTLSYVLNDKLGINGMWINPVIGIFVTISLAFVFSFIFAFIIDNIIINPILKPIIKYLSKSETIKNT
ncbi:acyltransferase [Clostridium sp. YIM B02506]|uniref:acyltransferase n=1 Tax=Clostridium sp. YIM B02506 TaxID=2910680 RepID=UPI001EEE5051|nr:acyltransferase [Clostridium sp. YIM B02506]